MEVLEFNEQTDDLSIILQGVYPLYLSAFTICAWFLTSMQRFPKTNINNPIFSYNSDYYNESIYLIIFFEFVTYQVGDTSLTSSNQVSLVTTTIR